MSLQLILGGSGSGKTTYLYDQVIKASMEHENQLYFMIVPEQFTMQTQKDIVMRHPRHGTMNIDIVSFQRLAYRIFEELAVENLQVLDDMGKSMVLRKVAAAQQRKLGLFQGHLHQAGFVNQLKSMLSEFYQYGITPQILREMAPLARTPLLRQKLEDFAVLFQSFQDYIEGHYITAEEVLDVLCRMLPKSKLIQNSVIALDGYTGFTPVQYRLAELLMVCAKQVIITVTADPACSPYQPMGMQHLFYMSRQMVMRLSTLAEKNQIARLQDIWIKPRPGEQELKYLEQHLFRYRNSPYTGDMTGSLKLYQAASSSEEVSCVAHQIHRLVKEEGLRYRDIAVVTGDLRGYANEIDRQFTMSGLPYFMDDKKDIMNNPMVELIRAALEAVRKDFSYESVFRYLKTGLITDNQEMTDRMENYVLALGIRGHKRWKETWDRTYRGGANINLVELNAFRDQVMEPLFAMREALRADDLTIAGMVQAVMDFLQTCRVKEKLEAYQAYFTEHTLYRMAKEYGQVYDMVWEMLVRLQELLGEEKAGRKEFLEILDAGFAELSVGVIPATVDRVVVGDITRTRLAHIQVLFFIGVNDGIVPARKDSAGLLSDRERQFFGEHHLELAPTEREDSFQQRFYLYLLMTKPAKRLIVSFAGVGGDGKSRRASFLIGELQKMFPKLSCGKWTRNEQTGQERPEHAGKEAALSGGEIYTMAEARRKLIAGLSDFRDGLLDGRERARFLELYRMLGGEEESREEIRRLVDAAFYIYEKQGIGHAVARALYGNIVSGSVTRLEQYAACAYGHFLKYGLELMERQRFELAAADIGNLFHDSIDLCFQKAAEEGKDWRTITDAERTSLVKACVEQVTAEYGNTILNSSSRNAYLAKRVEHITQRTIWALQQQILKGDFTPSGFEVSFSAADHLDALRISLSEDEAVHLRGRVDRMDLCEDGKKVYVKIIDYKSGSTSFDLLALYYGLQLQLVVYMDAVMELTKRRYPDHEVIPAGILYYNIGDPVVEKDGSEDEDQESIDARILKKLRMNGLINSELEAIHHLDNTIVKESDIIPVVLKDDAVQEGKSSVANQARFEKLRRFVHEKVRRAGREILDGEIGAEPYKSGTRTACDYCPYHAVCGFDKKTSGFEYRKLKNKKTEEIWEEICQ